MYLIGDFELEEIPSKANISYPIPSTVKETYVNNAHVRRDFRKEELGSFLIFKGSQHSRLLDLGVPFSIGSKPNELAKRVVKALLDEII